MQLNHHPGPLKVLRDRHYSELETQIEERMLKAHALAQMTKNSLDDELEETYAHKYLDELLTVYVLLGKHPQGEPEREKITMLLSDYSIELIELPSRELTWRFK